MATQKKPAQAKKRSGTRGPIIGILFLTGMFATPTALLVAFGLLPTYAAWLFDKDRNKLMAITVGSLNVAALTPLLMKLWSDGHSITAARALLMSPLSWLFIFIGSGVGWVLAQAIPAAIVVIISSRNKIKLEHLRARQKQLTDEWGASVTEDGRS